MKILHVIASCDPRDGGPIEGIRRIGDALLVGGHRQELLTLDMADDPWVRESPVPVHALGDFQIGGKPLVGRLLNYLRGAPRAIAWLKVHAGDYDGIVVGGLWNYATRVARLALPGGSTPYVVFCHGMLDPWFAGRYPLKHLAKKGLWHFNEGVLLRSAAAVAFTCEQERRLARTVYSPWGMREVVVGYGTSAPPAEGVDMVRTFRTSVPGLGDKPYLLFMSRIHEKKGCDILLHSFASVAEEFPGTDLVIAGPGDDALVRRYKALAEALGIEARVHWPGMLSGDAKWGALYGSTAMVLASHQENFGIIVVEALACGKPAVITDQVNIHDEISSEHAGFVGTDTAEGFAPQLRALLELTDRERDEMGTRGRDLFATRFDMHRAAQHLLDIFRDAAAGKEIQRGSD